MGHCKDSDHFGHPLGDHQCTHHCWVAMNVHLGPVDEGVCGTNIDPYAFHLPTARALMPFTTVKPLGSWHSSAQRQCTGSSPAQEVEALASQSRSQCQHHCLERFAP